MKLLAQTLLAGSAILATARAVSFTVSSSGGNATSPYQYGIMFEDINHSGDGGVYAELVQNRAFQGNTIYPSNLDYWYSIGGAELSLSNLSNPLSSALPTCMTVNVPKGSKGDVGFWNEGFWGFPIVSTWKYNGSFYMNGAFTGTITATLFSNTTNKPYASASVKVESTSKAWTQFSYTLSPSANAPDSNNTLRFTMSGSDVKEPLNFNLISLFPPTYNNRPNGLRVDLMEAMKALNPSFFRAPGGNNMEGNSAPYWWNWTQTIGPLIDRPGYPGTWGYQNTDGLGLIEYMLWAKDLNMEPVLAIWSGHYLNGDSLTKKALQPYVQSALDELEFLMGDTSTQWGAYRAKLGYPEPFQINFVEVGNEDELGGGDTTYQQYRFAQFYHAIRKAYPHMNIMSSYYYAPFQNKPYKTTSGDYHQYSRPVQMSSQFEFLDSYPTDSQLLLGEFAVIEYDEPGQYDVNYDSSYSRAYYPFWKGTVAEAIYLLSAERNSNKVIGASYAPTFMNMNDWQWDPDLISFDANPANLVLSTSYHMMKLFSNTRMTETLPMTSSSSAPAYWVAGRNANTGSHILKAAVYNATTSVPFNVTFQGVSAGTKGQLTYLTAPFNASNSVGRNVVRTRVSSVIADSQAAFSFTLPRYSVALLEIGN